MLEALELATSQG